MTRPNPRLQIYVTEKLAANLIVAAHRSPHPHPQGSTIARIDNDFFNSLLGVKLISGNSLRRASGVGAQRSSCFPLKDRAGGTLRLTGVAAGLPGAGQHIAHSRSRRGSPVGKQQIGATRDCT
jgi:hypothetical protein